MAIFDNCIIQAPDGVNLNRCGVKKVHWYVKRGLGTIVCEDPLTVRLNFEPSGRDGLDDPLLMSGKPNICVVCGATENLTRHHIIPYCFIRHMRVEYKADIIRDIFPLCESCHNEYHYWSNQKRIEIADNLGVKLHGLSEQEYHNLRTAKGAATALIRYADRIPDARVQELRQTVQNFLGRDFTEADLQELEETDLENHPGFVDVMKAIAQSVTNYSEFAKEWREHFVATMKPKYMPDAWKTDRVTELDKIYVPTRMWSQPHVK